jgi:hypothetical protein
MSFAIQLDQSKSLISVKLIGEFTPGLTLEFFQDLLLKIKHSGADKVFTDATEVELGAPIQEFRHIPSELVRIGFPKDLKRAILVSEDTETFKLWENMLFSMGFRQIRIFWSEEAALEWLIS